jgi:CheY-like chemotaxis protein
MTAPSSATPSPELPLSSASVLLAEDNPITSRLVVDYMTVKGFRMQSVTDGESALAAVRASPPDVVLLDIQMPQLDGFAVMRAIRADPDPRVRAVRVIALTAMAMRGDGERCVEAGADAYCAKPVSMRELVRLVQEQVASGGDRPGGAPVTAPA